MVVDVFDLLTLHTILRVKFLIKFKSYKLAIGEMENKIIIII